MESRRQRTEAITSCFQWLKDTNNHARILVLYEENNVFRFYLDELFRLREPPVPAWRKMLQDIVKPCFAPRLEPNRLETFRLVEAANLSRLEKAQLQYLHLVLTFAGDIVPASSSSSDSDDTEPSTGGYDGGSEA